MNNFSQKVFPCNGYKFPDLKTHITLFILFQVTKLTEALRIDDPVGAFAVHWGAGLWGVIAAAFFADGMPPSHKGIFRGKDLIIPWNLIYCSYFVELRKVCSII